MSKIILFNKPFQVLSQFSRSQDSNKTTLSDYLSIPDIYPAGRLDYDSEGLLLLTDNGALQHLLSHPNHKLEKIYWVQVEGQVKSDALQALERGVRLKDGITRPAIVGLLDLPNLWDRTPPIRERRYIPTQWLEVRIREGRNRQVRRMTAAVGHPTLRLIRVAIGPYVLGGLKPGEHVQEPIDVSLQQQLEQVARCKSPRSRVNSEPHPTKFKQPRHYQRKERRV